MKNGWTIRLRLLALGAVCVVAAIAQGSVSLMLLGRIDQAVRHTAELSSAIRLQGDADMMHDAIRGDVLAGMLAQVERDPVGAREAQQALAEHGPRFTKNLVELGTTGIGAETRAKLDQTQPVLEAYVLAANRFFADPAATPEVLKAKLADVLARWGALEDPMENLSDSIESDVALAADDLKHIQRLAMGVVISAVLLTALLAGLMAWSIYRAIHTPLGVAINAVGRVAAGDLAQKITVGRTDEIGQLLQSLDDMRESLANMFVVFQLKSVELDEASHALVSSATRVSTGSQEQRLASEEIAATLEEINQAIESVAERMNTARSTTSDASNVSMTGATVVAQLIDNMGRMDASIKQAAASITALGDESKHIGTVVSVIKDIADQTNLLALNAAIEAARAGEQGRGFAVVADEVRKLAERTTKSTEQIGNMIEGILTRVADTVKGVEESVTVAESGVRSAQEASQALQEIRAGVDSVGGNVAEAADAMREQATGAQHVAANAERISHMAEANSAVAADAERAARALTSISETLKAAAGIFKVAG